MAKVKYEGQKAAEAKVSVMEQIKRLKKKLRPCEYERMRRQGSGRENASAEEHKEMTKRIRTQMKDDRTFEGYQKVGGEEWPEEKFQNPRLITVGSSVRKLDLVVLLDRE